MLNMFDVLLFKKFFGEIQVGLLNKINNFFFNCQQALKAAALITGKAWTAQQPETWVSRSHPAPLETRKEWEHSQWRGKRTQVPDSVGSSHLRWVLTWNELRPNPISVISGGLWAATTARVQGFYLQAVHFRDPGQFPVLPGGITAQSSLAQKPLKAHTRCTAYRALCRGWTCQLRGTS